MRSSREEPQPQAEGRHRRPGAGNHRQNRRVADRTPREANGRQVAGRIRRADSRRQDGYSHHLARRREVDRTHHRPEEDRSPRLEDVPRVTDRQEDNRRHLEANREEDNSRLGANQEEVCILRPAGDHPAGDHRVAGNLHRREDCRAGCRAGSRREVDSRLQEGCREEADNRRQEERREGVPIHHPRRRREVRSRRLPCDERPGSNRHLEVRCANPHDRTLGGRARLRPGIFPCCYFLAHFGSGAVCHLDAAHAVETRPN